MATAKEVASVAALIVAQELKQPAQYGDAEMRPGQTLADGRMVLQAPPLSEIVCPSCGQSRFGPTYSTIHISDREFAERSAMELVLRYFVEPLHAVADLLNTGDGVVTYDLPIPYGVAMADRAVSEGVALRFVRAYDLVSDLFVHRFDVLYAPIPVH
jgi:hypothetical protein